MSKKLLSGFGFPAVVLATLYVACADPPKQLPSPGGAGTSGSVGDAGDRNSDAGSDAVSGGSGGTSGGVGDAGASAGGKNPTAGHAGTMESAGEGGTGPSAEGGDGGDGGVGATSQAGGGGTGGNACGATNVGGKSKIPVPVPIVTGVAKPSGVPGTLKVIDWAGFKGALSWTFDDSNQSQINDYAQLKATGVPLTFYLVGNHGANKPEWAQMALDGHELGNHTMHHCNEDGTGCTWNNGDFTGAGSELDDDTAIIESTQHVKVYSMAAPFGDGGWALPASTRFLFNRSVTGDGSGVKPNDTTNPFKLPCDISTLNETAVGHGTKEDPGLNSATDSAKANNMWRILLIHSFDSSVDSGYNPVAITEAVAAINYSKTQVWADTVTTIGAYWLAQKFIASAAPVTSGTDTVYSWTLPDHFPPGQFVRITVAGGTVKQCGTVLPWDDHGYYEVALDAGSLTISP